MLAALFVASALLAVEPPAKPSDAAAGGKYLEVPLKGEFGKEITALGIRDSLRAAKTAKAEAVVFVFDTPGGRVADAQAIGATIDKERGDLRVYSVIKRAISASVWPLAHSDRIFFAPGAAAGAAVAFHWDVKTGNAEVDSKFNAAVTAEVAGAAEAHGQMGCVYRAMMLQEARLYAWPVASVAGRVTYRLSDTKPTADIKGLEEIDSDTSVLAWTTEQAAKYGFGTIMPSADLACLGPIVGIEGWQSAGPAGASAMTHAFKEIERKAADTERFKEAITRNRDAVVDTVKRLVVVGKQADAADPANTVTVRYNTNGRLTGDSTERWKQATDVALGHWQTIQSLLNDLEKYERDAKRAVDDYNTARAREFAARQYTEKVEPLKLEPVDTGLDVKLWRKVANDTVSKLSAGRMRYYR